MLNELRPGFRFSHYTLLEQIGSGGQGIVWSAEDHQRNDIVAIKFNELFASDQQEADDEMFERQLGRLTQIQQEYILPIYDYGLKDEIRYLVSPYITGGSVYERIKRGALSLEDALRFSTEIASALDHLHSRGIIHRDIKSSNILLNLKNHTYLADFGLARSVSDTTKAMHTGRGTPPYSPPEQHKRLEITTKSDIYSFGILLFEIFAGQLPWGGETILGIQQLYSNAELPDPSELNNTLPPLMKDVLRRVTSADPARRPASAGEVMKMIYYIYEIKDFPLSESTRDAATLRARDADELFNQSLARWAMDNTKSDLGLTKFAVIHLDHKTKGQNSVQGGLGQFMLFHSLLYGYNEEYWWSRVTNLRDKLSVSLKLLGSQNEILTVRVLEHLIGDPDFRQISKDDINGIANSLLLTATRSTNPQVSNKIISGLQKMIPFVSAWNDSSLSPELNKLLGELASEDSDTGDEAARLIGHLHSETALKSMLNKVTKDRLTPALLEVQRSAGNLPSFVAQNLRLRVSLEWVLQRLTLQPARLFGAYMLALIGCTLGIAAQVYATYRLPEFMDVARISSSLEQGLITGAIFGFGIFSTRVIVERFPEAKVLPRLLIGTFVGALGINIAMFIFHVLFINTPPKGLSITFACILISLAYALTGLIHRRWLAMILDILAVILAIISTWWIHITMSTSITELTPFFRYEYTWSMSQVLVVAIIVAIPIGILGNLVNLAIHEE